ncbi:MAG: hypothetical protein JJU45_01890 [Acidimicrobiia bacterium]|nr:hypothetical protein [Acidimicrobiia bacterium]
MARVTMRLTCRTAGPPAELATVASWAVDDGLGRGPQPLLDWLVGQGPEPSWLVVADHHPTIGATLRSLRGSLTSGDAMDSAASDGSPWRATVTIEGQPTVVTVERSARTGGPLALHTAAVDAATEHADPDSAGSPLPPPGSQLITLRHLDLSPVAEQPAGSARGSADGAVLWRWQVRAGDITVLIAAEGLPSDAQGAAPLDRSPVARTSAGRTLSANHFTLEVLAGPPEIVGAVFRIEPDGTGWSVAGEGMRARSLGGATVAARVRLRADRRLRLHIRARVHGGRRRFWLGVASVTWWMARIPVQRRFSDGVRVRIDRVMQSDGWRAAVAQAERSSRR